MKTKKFDCVEMMHQGAERVRKEIEGMTIEQQVAYWKKRTDELRRLKERPAHKHNST